MLKLALALALVTAPMDYQVRSFVNVYPVDEAPTGQLQPSELDCIASRALSQWPGEAAADVVGLDYSRSNEDRSQVCLTWVFERSESVEDYVARDFSPTYVRFPASNDVAIWHDRMQPVCVPRGQTAPIVGCLSRFIGTPGQVTAMRLARQSTADPLLLEEAIELVSREPSNYAADRRAGVAIHHRSETPPPAQ